MRQGTHFPHDSFRKNRTALSAMSSMQVSSPQITTAPEPSIDPTAVRCAKSSGVSILMSKPIGCLMVWPCAYLYASSGPVIRLPMTQASTDQLVWMWVSPK